MGLQRGGALTCKSRLLLRQLNLGLHTEECRVHVSPPRLRYNLLSSVSRRFYSVSLARRGRSALSPAAIVTERRRRRRRS